MQVEPAGAEPIAAEEIVDEDAEVTVTGSSAGEAKKKEKLPRLLLRFSDVSNDSEGARQVAVSYPLPAPTPYPLSAPF